MTATTSDVLSSLWRLLRLAPRRSTALLAFLTAVTALGEGFGFALVVPLLGVVAGQEGGTGPLATLADLPLGVLLAGFVAVVSLRAGAETWRAVVAHDHAAAIVDTLRTRALSKLLHARWDYLSGTNRARAQAVLLTDIERVGYAGDLFAQGLRSGGLLVALGATALFAAPQAALLIASFGLLVAIVHAALSRDASRSGAAVTTAYERLTGQVQEALEKLRLVKSGGHEADILAHTDREVRLLRQGERAYAYGGAIARGVITVLAAILLVGTIAWLAGREAEPDWPVWIVLVALSTRVVPLLVALQQAWQQWVHERPALANAEALIAELSKVQEPSTTSPAPRLHTELRLERVTVVRKDRKVLDTIDLALPAGSVTAVEGRSGVGKTTLADVLAGMMAPDSGMVLLDGTPLAGGARVAWRSRVAYVAQDALFIPGTIRENLVWGSGGVEDAQVSRVIEQANARFVHDRPDSLEDRLAAGAHQLSGGEKQRLSLARALLRKPDLLILDEATSAVDPAGEAAIAESLRSLPKQCTVLIIAHRGRLTELADRRLLLSDGCLSEE